MIENAGKNENRKGLYVMRREIWSSVDKTLRKRTMKNGLIYLQKKNILQKKEGRGKKFKTPISLVNPSREIKI